MTDLDPAIWENPTLGEAAHNERLDRLEKQQHEDRAARLEGREPREVVVDNTYPDWTPEVNERTGTVPSNYQTVHFADENPNDIPVDSGSPDVDAGVISQEEAEDSEEPGSAIVEENEVETTEPDSTEESDSTQWT